jgi:DNA-binding transcriptional LysR family regulator
VLTVGVLPSQSMTVMPDASVSLTRSQPGLRIRIVEKPRDDLVAGLRRGEFDLIVSVIDDATTDPAIGYRELLCDRPAVVVRSGHPLGRAGRVQPAALGQFPWVVPPPGTDRRVFVERLFRSIGRSVLPNVIECHSVSFVKAVVMRSDYIGILPSDEPSPEQRAGLIRVLDLEYKPPIRRIGALFRADHPLTEAAAAMVRELQRAYSQMERHAGVG